jgi:hypothetical protein
VIAEAKYLGKAMKYPSPIYRQEETIVKMYLEKICEALFFIDLREFGYGKNAIRDSHCTGNTAASGGCIPMFTRPKIVAVVLRLRRGGRS